MIDAKRCTPSGCAGPTLNVAGVPHCACCGQAAAVMPSEGTPFRCQGCRVAEATHATTKGDLLFDLFCDGCHAAVNRGGQDA